MLLQHTFIHNTVVLLIVTLININTMLLDRKRHSKWDARDIANRWFCKAGRREAFRAAGLQCEMVQFISADVTPENTLLLAWNNADRQLTYASAAYGNVGTVTAPPPNANRLDSAPPVRVAAVEEK